MSVILQPQVAFPIVRQIANHLDSATYYVRAVVRDANGDTIDTVNLASQGGQRYQTSWQVPVDSSGQGRYISIVTSVYTDSGYTTKSQDYGDEETTYLIFDRVMPAMRGGGTNIDYFRIRQIVKEEVEEKVNAIEFPEQERYQMRWSEVLNKIDSLETSMSEMIAKAKPSPVNLEPVIGVVKDTVARGVNDLAELMVANQPQPVDLTPILNGIQEVRDSIVQDIKIGDLEDFKNDIAQNIESTVKKSVDEQLNDAEFASVFVMKKKKLAEPMKEEVEDLQEVTELQ